MKKEKHEKNKANNFPILVLFGVVIVVQFLLLVWFAMLISPNNPTNVGNGTLVLKGNDSIALKATQKIIEFSSHEDLVEFLNENQGKESVNMYYAKTSFGRAMEESAMVDAKVAFDDGGSGATEYSSTNVQIEGVDEADFIKNDGKYIYLITDNKLVIVDAYPGEDSKIVSEVKLNGTASELFINDNQLILFSNVQKESVAVSEYNFIPSKRYDTVTKVSVYDISNKENPIVSYEYEVDGYYSQARMIGEHVYLVSKENVYFYDDVVRIPELRIDDRRIESKVYGFDNPEDNYVFHTVSSLDLENGNLDAKSFMLGYSNTVFVSENNIYIAYNKGYSSWFIMNENTDMFEKAVYPLLLADVQNEIDSLDKNSMTEYEYRKEIVIILEDMYDNMEENEKKDLVKDIEQSIEKYNVEQQEERARTVIHKVSITDGNIEYVAKGEVKGNLLNQFSMDEHNDNLRVATTFNIWKNDGPLTYNNVYVLDKDMSIIGELEKIAPDERIFSTRFMGDKLYMVTFERVDPLFTIDLSDPKSPKILGQLKIPGFSNYLHPYGQNYLIGIGKDTYEENDRVITKGVKVSLFDISDFQNPKEVDYVTIGDSGSYSEVENDHKALLFDQKRGILVLPVREVEEKYKTDEEGYFRNKQWQRAYVFKVDENGFDELGKIDHYEGNDDKYYWNSPYSIKRSLFMDDYLYTVSSRLIKVNDINDIDEINEIELPYTEEIYYPYY